MVIVCLFYPHHISLHDVFVLNWQFLTYFFSHRSYVYLCMDKLWERYLVVRPHSQVAHSPCSSTVHLYVLCVHLSMWNINTNIKRCPITFGQVYIYIPVDSTYSISLFFPLLCSYLLFGWLPVTYVFVTEIVGHGWSLRAKRFLRAPLWMKMLKKQTSR